MLGTSVIQALNITDNDNRLTATGRPNQLAQFKVHKVASSICMFESIVFPQKFICIKDGVCDVNVSSVCGNNVIQQSQDIHNL